MASESASEDAMPFETAAEIAEQLAADLDLDDETAARAVELAETYGAVGGGPALAHTPRTTAAGAVYLATLESPGHRLTQEDVGAVADRHARTVGRCSLTIRHREYDMPAEDDDAPGSDATDLLTRVWRSLTGGEGQC